LRAEAWARRTAIAALASFIPWRCALAPQSPEPSGGSESSDRVPSAVEPKQELSAARVPSAPPRTPPPVASREAIALREEVVIGAIGAGQPAFLRCWARAQRMDPTQIASKVKLHLEVDAAGKVTSIASDTDSPTLSRCLAIVARQLPFPAPGQPAI